MLDTVEISIELGDDGCRSRVDIQIQLLQLPARMIGGAHSPPERLGSKLTDMDSRKRVPFLIEPVVLVRAAFDPLNIDQLYGLIDSGRSQQKPAGSCRNPSRFSSGWPGERGGSQRGN